MTVFKPRRNDPSTLALFSIALHAVAIVSAAAADADDSTPQQIRFFETKIRPVLVESCYRCHSNEGQGVRGGLSVDGRQGLLDGGDSGPAIVPGDLESSSLWRAINHDDVEMPPSGKLPESVIEDFKQWILMGAPDPRLAEIRVVPSGIGDDEIAAGRNQWAYTRPRRSPIPRHPDDTWSRTNIDRFVFAAMRNNGLSPAADCDSDTLLRRLHFDLIGLPPHPDQIREFAAACQRDPEQAVAEVVDRLLDSHQFGERWGRHWLDVARYAESSGKEVDATFPHAWRYRDWVIDALNEDKPYDRFVQEQIAGDLLPASSDRQWADQLVATGFLAIGPKTLTEQNPRQFKADLVDEQIDTTTRAILGVSVACARCHDHKFDPIPQTDYYALAGIFGSTETFFGGVSSRRVRRTSDLLILPIDDPNPFDASIDPDRRPELVRQLESLRQDYAEAVRVSRTPRSGEADDSARRHLLNQGRLDQQIGGLSAKLNSVGDDGRPLTFCLGVQDADEPSDARLLVRGDVGQPAQPIRRGFIRVIDAPAQTPDEDSSGRLELARWMTSRENPLTARVMVNRIWLHLLGRGIVEDPDNFGMSGPGPSHPELLDHLAIEFMDDEWSVKSVVRGIVTSRPYRLASAVDDESFLADPENRYFSRGNRRRLEAEAIRDAMLMISGRLNLDRPRASEIAEYGPAILGPDGRPPLVSLQAQIAGRIRDRLPARRGAFADRFFGGRGTGRSSIENDPATPKSDSPDFASPHRSVYLPIARGAVPRSLEVFDFADTNMLNGRREASDTADQALFLMNNPLVVRAGDDLARKLLRSEDSVRPIVESAFLTVFGRTATPDELRESIHYLRGLATASPGRTFSRRRVSSDVVSVSALSQFCHALLASAEFRYLD